MDCEPNGGCPPTPAPVMPRCDVVLLDGTYANATVVVDNGCIVDVQAGTLQVYTPDACCPTTGTGGGGGDGLDGPPGPPGTNATITPGAVTSLAAGAAPTVTNVGTPTAAILNFGIPRGADGADGSSGTVGVTDTSAGIVIDDGVIKSVPVQWPPIMLIDVNPVSTPGVTLSAVENPLNGTVLFTLDVSIFVTQLEAGFNAQLALIGQQMSALQTQIVSLQTALLVCCPTAVLDIDGDGGPNPGGTPGVSPPPPVSTN